MAPGRGRPTLNGMSTDDTDGLTVADVTIAPSEPATAGRDRGIACEGRRLPVVDAAGLLHGVLAVTTDLRHFACRPAAGRPADRGLGPQGAP
jgi:hypothetical protein